MMIWDDPSWDEELIRFKRKPIPELPEDMLFKMLEINPILSKLIEKFNLEIEY